jgi:hypothetical protein
MPEILNLIAQISTIIIKKAQNAINQAVNLISMTKSTTYERRY